MARRRRDRPFNAIDFSGRDEIANAEVAEILSVLPEDHPARQAFAAGRDTVAISHLVADRPDLVERLMATYFAANWRVMTKGR